MSPEWIQVRLRRETHTRLRGFGDRCLRLMHEGRLVLDNPVDDKLSIDLLVSLLLDRDDGHQQRNKRRKRGKQ